MREYRAYSAVTFASSSSRAAAPASVAAAGMALGVLAVQQHRKYRALERRLAALREPA